MCGTQRLRVVVHRFEGGQSCSRSVYGWQVDRLAGRQVHMLTKYIVLSVKSCSPKVDR